jgi:hypothetical protein
MKRFNRISKTFNFHITNEYGLNTFNLNDIDISFTISFFTYTPNLNYYLKALALEEMNIEMKI